MVTKKLKTLFYLVCLSCPQIFFGQIHISESIQANKLSKQETNKLYFVDFWATWCGPCVHAKKYLGILQQQFPEDFYVISLSEENPETVRKFLKKQETKLAIAIDYNSETFKAYNIRSLPQGILFNARGEKLWEGHPADLKDYEINRFLKQNQSRVSIDEFIKLEAYQPEVVIENDYVPTKDFEITEGDSEQLQVIHKQTYTIYKGSLKNLIARANNISEEQVILTSADLNRNYTVYVKFQGKTEPDFKKPLLKALKIKQKEATDKGEVLLLEMNNANFWDTNQIDWGMDSPRYLIDDMQIQADNVNLTSIGLKLASVLEMPVIIEGNTDFGFHDWQIHYKYFALMQTDLLDNYGIRAEKKVMEYPVVVISKKAP